MKRRKPRIINKEKEKQEKKWEWNGGEKERGFKFEMKSLRREKVGYESRGKMKSREIKGTNRVCTNTSTLPTMKAHVPLKENVENHYVVLLLAIGVFREWNIQNNH